MGVEVDSPCGPGAPCRARIQALVAAHRTALQELQEKHRRETRDLEAQRDRLLQEGGHGSARGEDKLGGMWCEAWKSRAADCAREGGPVEGKPKVVSVSGPSLPLRSSSPAPSFASNSRTRNTHKLIRVKPLGWDNFSDNNTYLFVLVYLAAVTNTSNKRLFIAGK